MEPRTLVQAEHLPADLDTVGLLISQTQKETGEIPWCPNDKTDPWDMVEAAMGLGIAGYIKEAQKAFEWLAKNRLPDGSWYSAYRNGLPEDKTRETNMTAYIAVGVFHHFMITRDIAFLRYMWKTVKSAIDFAINLQTANGEIYWAYNPEGEVDPMALLTGSSSIYMSLKCALAIAEELGVHRSGWKAALIKLGNAIRYKQHLFDKSKSRFSMDWFYPILCGAFTGSDAQRRVDLYWNKFVVVGKGVRCVSDEPWITVAETSELALALHAMGNRKLSKMVFDWIQDKRFDDGSYWCGVTFPDGVIWPEDKLTWTNAVVLMAADALFSITPAGEIFNHNFWKSSGYLSLRDVLPHSHNA